MSGTPAGLTDLQTSLVASALEFKVVANKSPAAAKSHLLIATARLVSAAEPKPVCITVLGIFS